LLMDKAGSHVHHRELQREFRLVMAYISPVGRLIILNIRILMRDGSVNMTKRIKNA
jgi:hypothetical protein